MRFTRGAEALLEADAGLLQPRQYNVLRLSPARRGRRAAWPAAKLGARNSISRDPDITRLAGPDGIRRGWSRRAHAEVKEPARREDAYHRRIGLRILLATSTNLCTQAPTKTVPPSSRQASSRQLLLLPGARRRASGSPPDFAGMFCFEEGHGFHGRILYFCHPERNARPKGRNQHERSDVTANIVTWAHKPTEVAA